VDAGRGDYSNDYSSTFVNDNLFGDDYRCTGLYGHGDGKHYGNVNHGWNGCPDIWIDPGDVLFRKSAP